MKKFLVILMVVAMASFLFVGCIPTTPAEEAAEEEAAEEEEVVVAATVAPIVTAITDAANVVLIALTSTATQYMNAADVAAGIIVHGTAPTYSEVKVYVDDVCAGTGNTGDTGIFEVVVAKADLGADAADKVIYATAKEVAIDVSAHSVEYAFVLDTVKPSATTLTATAVTADSAVATATSGTAPVAITNVTGTGTVAAGTWTISCVADSGVTSNVVISDGTTSTTYTVSTLAVFNGIIPGVTITFAAFNVGDACTIVVTPAVASRATILFDEEITYATANTATWTNVEWATSAVVIPAPVTFLNHVSKTSYYSPVTTVAGLAQYDTLRCTVNGATDLAGNTQTTASVLSCTVAKASATSLAP